MMKFDKQLIIDTSLLAGKIMLENGAETSRVEDTMERIICNALGKQSGKEPYTYVTVNGIFVKLEDLGTKFHRIDNRSHDLNKITKVNQLSRSFADKKISLWQMNEELLAIEREENAIPLWLKLLCTAVLSGSIILILGGKFIELPAAMISALLAYLSFLYFDHTLKKPFLSEFLAVFLGGTAGYYITTVTGGNIDSVLIGTVAPLVPGIAITNAIRDLMAKHFLSGFIRAMEGIFIAAALGGGVATVYYIFIV